jgi:NADH dehydrogenase
VVWAAGNEATPLAESLDVPLDRQGRAHVAADCSLDGRPEIFVVGDAAAFHDRRGRVLPGLAPVAMQMGSHAARVILADLAGKKRPPFRFHDKGQLAVIGRGRAVADLGRLRFGGFVAWLIWIFVHIAYLIGFRNRIIVLMEWGWSYFTFQRGARLITGEVDPLAGSAGRASP